MYYNIYNNDNFVSFFFFYLLRTISWLNVLKHFMKSAINIVAVSGKRNTLINHCTIMQGEM